MKIQESTATPKVLAIFHLRLRRSCLVSSGGVKFMEEVGLAGLA